MNRTALDTYYSTGTTVREQIITELEARGHEVTYANGRAHVVVGGVFVTIRAGEKDAPGARVDRQSAADIVDAMEARAAADHADYVARLADC